MMECHSRLHELYSQLADDENADACTQAQYQLVQQMELYCNFCAQRYGEADDSLQALNCSHIFHEKLVWSKAKKLKNAKSTIFVHH